MDDLITIGELTDSGKCHSSGERRLHVYILKVLEKQMREKERNN